MKKVKLNKITKAQMAECIKFSYEVVDTNMEAYKERKQPNRNKVVKDILYGKVAEFAIYNELTRRGKLCSYPDLNIYPKFKKSFDADLEVEGMKLHVKSCQEDTPYGISWVFQPWDTLTYNPDPDEYIALACIDQEGKGFAYYMKAADAVGSYEPPKLKHLKKKVLYNETISK